MCECQWPESRTLFKDDYCCSVTPKVTQTSDVTTASQAKSSVPPRLATVCHVAIRNKEYLGKRLVLLNLITVKYCVHSSTCMTLDATDFCLIFLTDRCISVVSLPFLNFIITQLLCYIFVMQVIVACLLLMLFTNIFDVMLWRGISV